MLILPTKFHPNLFTLSVFEDSPFLPPAPPVSLDPVGVQNKSSETRGPFKIQSPVLKLKITQFFRIRPPPPNPPPPQRDKIHFSYVNHVSRTCAYSSHQVSSRSLHSKCFPRFPVSEISVSPNQPIMSPNPIRIENGGFET